MNAFIDMSSLDLSNEDISIVMAIQPVTVRFEVIPPDDPSTLYERLPFKHCSSTEIGTLPVSKIPDSYFNEIKSNTVKSLLLPAGTNFSRRFLLRV